MWIKLFLIILCFIPLPLYAVAPVLVCSDLTDGPTTGWDGSATQGAAVSVWGLNFGASGHIDIAGQEIASTSCAEWNATTNPTTARGLGRITFYLNSSMTTGSTTIQVTTSGGSSNTIPFYTRALGSNKILFVATDGSDATTRANNDLTHPWATLGKVRSTAEAGDCIYVRGGTYLTEDAYDCIMAFYQTFNTGTLNNSISVSAYPAENVAVGDGSASTNYFMWVDPYGGTNTTFNYWTFSKMTIKVYNKVFYLWSSSCCWNTDSTGFRIIGNSVQHTYGGATNGLGFTLNLYGNLNDLYILANYFPNCGYGLGGDQEGTSKYCIYIGGGWPSTSGTATSSSNIHIGWNEMYHSSGRGIDIYAHKVNDVFDDVYIYNNYLHVMGTNPLVIGGGDGNASGASSWASIGTAYIYNNIFEDGGSQSKITDGSEGSVGGTFYYFNNSHYGLANTGSTCDFQVTGPTLLQFDNNIVDSVATADCYFSYYGGSAGGSTGGHNLFRGSSGSPTWSTTGDLEGDDPKYSDATPTAYTEFQLASDSPCINAGTVISTYGAPWDTYDFYGVARGASWDIGAIEYGAEASATSTLVNCILKGGVHK